MQNFASERLFTKNYVIVWIVNFAMVICAFPSMTILPLYLSAEITSNTFMIGMIIGVFAVTALLSRFVAGWTLDNYPIAWSYRGSVLVFALFWFLYTLPRSPEVFLALRILHGFAFGFTTISGAAAAVRIIPVHRRGEGLGYFGISLSVGMALGPFIALTIVEASSFFAYFIFLGFWGLVSLALLCLVRFEHTSPVVKKPFNFGNIFLKKGFGLMISMFILVAVLD